MSITAEEVSVEEIPENNNERAVWYPNCGGGLVLWFSALDNCKRQISMLYLIRLVGFFWFF